MSRAEERLSSESQDTTRITLHSVRSVVRLTLPFPPSALSPNARPHWRTKARIVADYRERCGWRAKGAQQGINWKPQHLEPPIEATVTFVVPDRRKRDEDNLLAMLKPAWDGLVDAGVLAGDDHANFKVGKVSIEVGEPKVIVELVSRVETPQPYMSVRRRLTAQLGRTPSEEEVERGRG